MLHTLQSLKDAVFPRSWAATAEFTTYDAILQQIGEGVADAIADYCGRTLIREVDQQTEFVSWDGLQILPLGAYPIEGVPVVELSNDDGATWTALTVDKVTDRQAGVIRLESPEYADLLRVTWTGGYWVDPDDESEIPVGAYPVPRALRQAWLYHCQEVIQATDALGEGALKERTRQEAPGTFAYQMNSLNNTRMSDQVMRWLEPYRRMSGTA